MDVQCERCKTEYVFDDALVSGRGTTVRCTNCGHQFKVRRIEAGDATADRWVVRTAVGQPLTFLTLRELQRAILAKQVGRSDLLILAGAPARPLGSIAELEPFFEGRASSRPPPSGGVDGHAATAVIGPDLSIPPGGAVPFGIGGPEPLAVVGQSPSVRAPVDVPPGPLFARSPDAATAPQSFADERWSSPLPPPTVPVRRAAADVDDEVHDVRAPPSSDEAYDYPRRRRVGGWIVAFVLMLAVGVVGWVVAKPYLVARGGAGEPQPDGRATAFVADGERAMADGDLETAQRDFDKASALAERDPRVLVDEARVAAASADVPWLKLRLLSGDAADELRTTRAQFDERLARARKAADDALAAAPDDTAALRAKIDALRLAGEREAARGYVSRVSSSASQPETAYVLAALDLAEPQPVWVTVIDRLRLAAAAEGNAGRARAALIYALARSGDAVSARTELSKLDAAARPYALLPNLHALVDRTPAKGALDAGGAPTAPRAEPGAPRVPATGAAAAAVAPQGGDAPLGAQSAAMQAASQAFKKGDFVRARRIYEALVARNAADSEALAGIGDVDRAQGDSAGAIASYKRALAVNPSYLPALLGVADTQWATGDRASARASYKDIVDRFPDGTYPSYVKQRSETASPPAATTAAAGTAPAATAESGGEKASDPTDGL